MVPLIVREKEEEGDMATNLRAGFWERHYKCLSKSIVVNPTPSKRAYPEPVCSEPISTLALVSSSSTIVVEITPKLDEKLHSVEYIAHHELRRPSIGPDHFSEETFGCMAYSSSRPMPNYIPNRDEVVEFLRQISSLIERETLVQDMTVLFPATQQILIEIKSDMDRSSTTCFSYGTPDTAISHIMPMLDYTTFEMAEVVSRSPFLFILS